MDRRIKFRQVEAFVEIARQGSFKAAAEALGLTQPAISKILRDLEDIMGAALMERGRGGVTLTAEGEVFLAAAEASLGALRQGFDGVARLGSGAAGRIAVGALPSVAARVLPKAALGFQALAPEITLSFQDGPHGYLMDRLRGGALELVVGRMGPAETMRGITFTQLYSERVAFVVRKGHPLSGQGRLAALRDYPAIYPEDEAAIRPLVARLFISRGMAILPQRIETVSGAFGRALCRMSDAVWIISEGVVADDIAAGHLEKLPIDAEPTAGPIGVMARAGESHGGAARLFRRSLEEAVEALGLGA